jgi:DNA excision repair protein ERCC-3
LSRFAELVKSPEYIHTYKITPLSLWNAAASGVKVDTVLGALEGWSKYQVPPNVPVSIRETMARYGKLKLLKADDGLVLVADDPILLKEVRGLKGVKPLLRRALDDRRVGVDTADRGLLKQELLKANHPVEDLAGYIDGAALAVELKKDGWGLRAYQQLAVDAFLGDGGADGGSGVVVLPCGAGKTIVGLATLARLGMKTLILCTNVTALRQWREEIIARTTLRPEDVGEYSGEKKDILPVTLSTYQMLTWRKSKDAEFVHFDLFDKAVPPARCR